MSAVIEPEENQNSLGFYNRLFLLPKCNNWWRPILDLSTLNTFLDTESFKMETPETIRTSLQLGVGHIHRLQRRILPHTNSQSVQEVHAFSHPGSVIPVQSPTLWPFHSSHGVHSGSQRGQVHGTIGGYKDPPVPRRLVGESHIPSNFSPAYRDLGSSLSKTRLAGEQGEVRTGSKAGLQLHRLPVQSQGRQGQTRTRTFSDLNRQNSGNIVQSGVSGPTVHVPHGTSHSHRKTSPHRSTSYETHSVALEKQLESTGITRKGDTRSQFAPPSFKVVVGGRQCSSRSTITPTKTYSADLYRSIKRRLAHLNERTARGTWSFPESKLHINHLELKAVFLVLKEFQDLIVLVATDNTTVVAYINKKGG